MRVLFLHDNHQDYLADSLFHGLRTLLGRNCVDVPRYDYLYAPLTDAEKSKLRGNGFTLYGLLEEYDDLASFRDTWRQDIDTYDLIVIANIWRQWKTVRELSKHIDPKKIAILDGEDLPSLFPFAWHLRRQMRAYSTPIKHCLYFKREMVGGGQQYHLENVPSFLEKFIRIPRQIRRISFAVPAEKIWDGRGVEKTKDFPTHIVDDEVAAHIEGAFFSPIGSDKLHFKTEDEYYHDLRQSRFGVTTKRAGWDCMRHYELAANGCVLCFRDLDLKPGSCAPHGLSSYNCIIYHDAAELMSRVAALSSEEYTIMKKRTYDWICQNTTKIRGYEFLQACGN